MHREHRELSADHTSKIADHSDSLSLGHSLLLHSAEVQQLIFVKLVQIFYQSVVG